jgi:hypothetical protein
MYSYYIVSIIIIIIIVIIVNNYNYIYLKKRLQFLLLMGSKIICGKNNIDSKNIDNKNIISNNIDNNITSNNKNPNNKNVDHKQSCIMNNIYSKSNSDYNQVIWDTIDKADDSLIKSLNAKIFDVYQGKLNLINNILNSTIPLPIKTRDDIKKLFNIIAPLNNEYNFGSYKWNFMIPKNQNEKILLIQNSITKYNFNEYVLKKYIEPIQNILKLSNIDYKYFEFKSKRFYKNIDIVFVIRFL